MAILLAILKEEEAALKRRKEEWCEQFDEHIMIHGGFDIKAEKLMQAIEEERSVPQMTKLYDALLEILNSDTQLTLHFEQAKQWEKYANKVEEFRAEHGGIALDKEDLLRALKERDIDDAKYRQAAIHLEQRFDNVFTRDNEKAMGDNKMAIGDNETAVKQERNASAIIKDLEICHMFNEEHHVCQKNDFNSPGEFLWYLEQAMNQQDKSNNNEEMQDIQKYLNSSYSTTIPESFKEEKERSDTIPDCVQEAAQQLTSIKQNIATPTKQAGQNQQRTPPNTPHSDCGVVR